MTEIENRLDSLEDRVDDCESMEERIDRIVGSVQSVVAVPDMDDGSVELNSCDTTTIKFEVFPRPAADSIAQIGGGCLRLNAVYTSLTKSSQVELEIHSVHFDGTYLNVTAGVSDIDSAVLLGNKGISARLLVTGGEIIRSSEYFSLRYGKSILPKLISFDFSVEDNSRVLIDDVSGSVDSEARVVSLNVPYMISDKILTPRISYYGVDVLIDGESVAGKSEPIDFNSPKVLTVVGKDGLTEDYSVFVTMFTGLPIMRIDTENREEVTEKEKKINCSVVIEGNSTFESSTIATGTIKGRGNSTWYAPKKPYKIKFDKKLSLLGMPADKEWVLLANYYDKTQIRNDLAFYIGRGMSTLDYTSRSEWVELIMNGTYLGTYQLAEHQKISKDRVPAGDNGYLLEIDAKAAPEDVCFNVPHIPKPINIKEPDVESGDEKYNLVKRYVEVVDSVLFDSNFADPENGYAKYIDVTSFVDWYLINEISKNNDAQFYTSCFMHYTPGGKLIMGPIWDFDLAFGNTTNNKNYEVEGLWIQKVKWYTRLFKDPAFESQVKVRFNYFYENMDVILSRINDDATYLGVSAVENNYKWSTLYKNVGNNGTVLGRYENEVSRLKSWTIARMNWLKSYFDGVQ